MKFLDNMLIEFFVPLQIIFFRNVKISYYESVSILR